jgi:hypothetical protein
MPECNLPLPCSSTCSGDTCAFEPAFTISNPLGTTINAVGRTALSAGNPAELGPGGTAIQGSSVFGTGVLGTSAEQIGVIGAGGAAGVQASSERGRAGWFEIGNTNNNSAALFAQTFGGGAAVEGLIPFSSRPGEATGRAGFFRKAYAVASGAISILSVAARRRAPMARSSPHVGSAGARGISLSSVSKILVTTVRPSSPRRPVAVWR